MTLHAHSLPRTMWRGASQAFPIRSARDIWRRVRLLCRLARHRAHLATWIDSGHRGGLGASIEARPLMVGVAEWPYICTKWTAADRFDIIRGHYAELDSLPWMQVAVYSRKALCDLGDLVPGLCLVLDRPNWFIREGELTLNLFVQDERVYSLAFTLGRLDNQRVAYVGAVQGRNLDSIQDVYKQLTKALHGTRPRDFMITCMQLLCEVGGVDRLLGVSEECRHHNHPYFGNKRETIRGSSYDDIWSDRGGSPLPNGFFELPSRMTVRDEADIPSQKRPMYRRRYELFARVRRSIREEAGLPAELALAAVA